MTNRRGFLGLLAHLPLVGAWFIPKYRGGQHQSPEGLTKPPPPPAPPSVWITHPYARMIRWIPVTERLPDNCRMVLVCDEADGVVWTSGINADTARHWIEEHHVTHWAELPAAPQKS